MDQSTINMVVGGSIGAVFTGFVGLLFFFVRRYFLNREDKQQKTEIHVDKARLDIAGLEAVVKSQSEMLLEVRDDTKFIRKQMVKIFAFIDAPKRATDQEEMRS